MTRKDYERVAAAILGERTRAVAQGGGSYLTVVDQLVTLGRLAGRLAETFAHGNERFDEGRFFAACGMSEEEVATVKEWHEFHRLAVLRSLTEKAGA